MVTTHAKFPHWLLSSEVAELLRRPDATLRVWRSRGEGPPFRKLGRSVVYDEADVLAWLDAQPTGGAVLDTSRKAYLGGVETDDRPEPMWPRAVV